MVRKSATERTTFVKLTRNARILIKITKVELIFNSISMMRFLVTSLN
jgi:hypothetical protein